MGIFKFIVTVVTAPVTVAEKTINALTGHEDSLIDSGISPADIITCGLTRVSKSVKEVAEEIDKSLKD